MELQLTALTTLVGIVIMLSAWYFVGARIKQSHTPVLRPVWLLSRFFLFSAIFFAFMLLPHFSLFIAPDNFPLLMALGYVIGHVFLYIALLYVVRMTCSMIPKLANKEKVIVIVWSVAIVVVTAVNTVTMVFGAQPFYDYERHLTQVNAAPFVGIAIALFATLALLPAAILFIINAIKTTGARRVRPPRSLVAARFRVLIADDRRSAP